MKNSKKYKRSLKGIADKIRSSLVLKLNLRMLWMLLAAFITVNILLFIIFTGLTLWQAEDEAAKLIDAGYLSSGPEAVSETEALVLGNYEINILEEESSGISFFKFLRQRLPLPQEEVRRSMNWTGLRKSESITELIESVTYQINLPLDETFYQLSYPLGPELKIYLYLLLFLFAVEFFYILGSIRKNNRVIRKTLKPLSEMADKARELQQDLAALSTGSEGDKIKDLAGAISSIDARQLDKQISVDSSQEELKDLAHAINNMLYRINQSYQSQARFVADASHELRTPISVIQGYASLLERWGKDDQETLEESIAAIKSETEQMKLLVEHLLFLARSDNEAIQLQKAEFDLSEVTAEIIRDIEIMDSSRNQDNNRDHIIETELQGPVYVLGDKQLIRQAIRILLDNSIKYTPPGEKVSLKIFQREGKANIQVQDNGIGIAAEDLPHIFDRFYRSDESRARKTGGSGLGLAIAKWIIENHEGHFEVLSRVNIGTRINILLPVVN